MDSFEIMLFAWSTISFWISMFAIHRVSKLQIQLKGHNKSTDDSIRQMTIWVDQTFLKRRTDE